MAYTIERAAPGDEAALAYIHTESWKAGFRGILDPETLENSTQLDRSIAMYQRLLAADFGKGYLLKVDGTPHCLAWWNATRSEDMPGYAELICIHSLPGHWQCGYGSHMMDTVLQDMADAGYKKVMLWVFEENTRARKFYEAKGFVTYGKVKPESAPVEICYERDLP
jgi:ribosomal protein S18 acetylase RimI-like enzyme